MPPPRVVIPDVDISARDETADILSVDRLLGGEACQLTAAGMEGSGDWPVVTWCSDGARLSRTIRAQTELFQHGVVLTACR